MSCEPREFYTSEFMPTGGIKQDHAYRFREIPFSLLIYGGVLRVFIAAVLLVLLRLCQSEAVLWPMGRTVHYAPQISSISDVTVRVRNSQTVTRYTFAPPSNLDFNLVGELLPFAATRQRYYPERKPISMRDE